ncbi:uncharacterized protein LAESUDRAFT_760795 [Laetiporus sulphureus 93-53]|uniref:Uncharacterized protein n=1 Tax=Laetiporus sulphureus 93-53 TaxID=1314785 RepID=A0A165DF78_9APHY|nr:uncharacterized protein LAESUDRAFT_760795 [Laetiporus sulphureus 93-53]KZT04763.1 hypothetical protein LAESUDRAFT_760795 [Laetiporus sulphureus 93-53]
MTRYGKSSTDLENESNEHAFNILAMLSPAASASSMFNEVSNLRHTAEAVTQPISQPAVSIIQLAQTMQPALHWYCVMRGHAVGVFISWTNVLLLITDLPGSIYQCHANFGAALTVFIEAAGNGTVQIIF